MKRSYFTREITYTDDCDFITGDPEGKEEKQQNCQLEMLKTGNRLMNAT